MPFASNPGLAPNKFPVAKGLYVAALSPNGLAIPRLVPIKPPATGVVTGGTPMTGLGAIAGVATGSLNAA